MPAIAYVLPWFWWDVLILMAQALRQLFGGWFDGEGIVTIPIIGVCVIIPLAIRVVKRAMR